METLRIAALVEDLHLLSLSDSNELSLIMEPLSPQELIDRAVEPFKERFDRRRIRLMEEKREVGSVRISADKDRLGQVFDNILENACRYVQPPGALSIRVEVEDGAVTFTFADTGPGVPAESLPRLFDRLYRVDSSRDRSGGGSGLGLSICKNIVECHGGSIWAENNANGGLTIVVRLPSEKKRG